MEEIPLPSEIRSHIYSYLTLRDLRNLRVCSRCTLSDPECIRAIYRARSVLENKSVAQILASALDLENAMIFPHLLRPSKKLHILLNLVSDNEYIYIIHNYWSWSIRGTESEQNEKFSKLYTAIRKARSMHSTRNLPVDLDHLSPLLILCVEALENSSACIYLAYYLVPVYRESRNRTWFQRLLPILRSCKVEGPLYCFERYILMKCIELLETGNIVKIVNKILRQYKWER